MLGFISRSAQNASFGQLYNAWAPDSFGSRRVFNFDNILGAVTLLTHSPMVTVKLLDVLTLFGAGLTTYALAWSWYRSRLVATFAGLFYMVSQTSLSRWGSGQLNVEIITSLAPLMLLTFSYCLEHFTIKRGVEFTFTMGIAFLVRADLVLYVVPFLVLYAAVMLATRQGFQNGLINVIRTLALSIPGVLLLNAAWLVPSLSGYRALYETLNQIFSITQLTSRSLTFYQSLLGFGREIGYFAYTGMQTWNSYPWLPLWTYYAVAALVPLLAYSALWWHRDRRAVFLVLGSVLSTLIAPGTRPPLGALYLWAARNIPVFGNLRDPNRWLVIQAIAYAVLASLTIERLARTVSVGFSRGLFTKTWALTAQTTLILALVSLGLVPVLPTLVVGLRTWHVTGPQQALLKRVRDAAAPGRLASVPFDQNLRFVVQGSYKGWEHDLGFESPLFTARPDLAMGGWNQRSANFVRYEATLLDQGNPAFTAMLASAGVDRAVSFNYPLVAPQLLSRSVGPYTQQHIISKLPGLKPILSNSAGTDYLVDGAATPLSFRRDIAVVLGGSQGVAALADQAGVKLSDWAVFTADDVIETQGYPELLALMRKANLVLLANERPLDTAVEGTAPLTKLVGITSDPQINRLVTNVPTGQSAQTGSLTDLTIPIPQPRSTSSSSVFSVRSRHQVAIWARVLATSQAATIQASVDGMRVGSVTPVSLGHGFEWVRIATVYVGAGTHKVTISALPSRFGDSYEVEEARVLEPNALHSAEVQLSQVLAARATRVAYDFSTSNVAKWSWASLASRVVPARSSAVSLHAWTVPKGTHAAKVTATTGPNGGPAQLLHTRGRRSTYTFAEIYYKKSQNWMERPYVYLEFKGTGSGRHYQLIFDSGHGRKKQARYTFVDNSTGWKTLAFPTSQASQEGRSFSWSRVVSVLIASLPSRRKSDTLTLGALLPSEQLRSLTVPLPIIQGSQKRKTTAFKLTCIGNAQGPAHKLRVSRNALIFPVSSLNSSCSIYMAPQLGYRQEPAKAVSLHRIGTERWSYSFSTHESGALVWTQAYDPLWRVSGAGVKAAPLPVLSLLDGYLVSAGYHSGTIAFKGESRAITGVATTALTSLALLLAALLIPRTRRRRTPSPQHRHMAMHPRHRDFQLSSPPPVRNRPGPHRGYGPGPYPRRNRDKPQ